MERYRDASGQSEAEPGSASGASKDSHVVNALQRYSAGEISAREAAKEMGPAATEHDVFAGIIAAHLPVPKPPAEQVEREVAALRALYGKSRSCAAK